MENVSNESQIQLAQMLLIRGVASMMEKPANCQKLYKTEESTFSTWILDTDSDLPL